MHNDSIPNSKLCQEQIFGTPALSPANEWAAGPWQAPSAAYNNAMPLSTADLALLGQYDTQAPKGGQAAAQ
jgi:hypothetical protein